MELVIIHGGDNGEFHHYDLDQSKTTYIFEVELPFLKTFDLGES